LASEIAEVEAELFIQFTGWTFQGYVKGAYQMPDGTKALDESAAYVVVIDDSQIAELERLLIDFKSKTTQDAIYLEIQRDVDVRLL
jgi:hypothetical protein